MTPVSTTFIRRHSILVNAILVWLLFLASFLMPVVKSDSMVGWQAFLFYMEEMWNWQGYWREVQQNPMALWSSAFPSTNCAMFIAPVILFRWPRWSGWLGCALTLGGLVPLFGFFEMIVKNELRAGYYCWVGSILLMAILSLLCAKNKNVLSKAT